MSDFVAIIALLFCVVFGANAVKERKNLKSEDKDTRIFAKACVAFSVFGFVAIVFASRTSYMFYKDSYSKEEQTAVYKVSTDFKYSGTDDKYFEFITADEDGEPIKLRAPMSESEVIYQDNIKPYVVEYTICIYSKKRDNLWYKLFVSKKKKLLEKTYKIYLPNK